MATTFGGRKIELIVKDDSRDGGRRGRALAQELVVKNKVASSPVSASHPQRSRWRRCRPRRKKPMVIMNAGNVDHHHQTPYTSARRIRCPGHGAHRTWAAKNKIKKVIHLVADFGPGHDAEASSRKHSTAAGGEIVGECGCRSRIRTSRRICKRSRIPSRTVFLFMPARSRKTIALHEGFRRAGLRAGRHPDHCHRDLTDEDVLDATGIRRLGSPHRFIQRSAQSPENKATPMRTGRRIRRTGRNSCRLPAMTGCI